MAPIDLEFDRVSTEPLLVRVTEKSRRERDLDLVIKRDLVFDDPATFCLCSHLLKRTL